MFIVKRCLYFGVFVWFFVYFGILGLEVVKIDNTTKMVQTYAEICADSAVLAFQDESNMDLYTAPGTSSSMSQSYVQYINWLEGYPEYRDIAGYLRTRFTEGVTSGNFALPYLDKEKVNELFEKNLNEQLDAFNRLTGTSRGFFLVDNINTKVTDFVLTMRSFGSDGKMFGNNSSFSSNTDGHDMLYNYHYYPSYFVEFEVEYEIPIIGKMTSQAFGNRKEKCKVVKTYELFN